MNELKKSDDLTLEYLQNAIPSRKNTITEDVVTIIRDSMDEPEFQGESLLRTAITYEAVLQRNKASITEYLNAIRFCAYMLSLDDNYTEAYKKVFFDREFVKARLGLSTEDSRYKELTSAASRYRRSKIVTDILTVSQVPLDLIFAGDRVKAVGVLADIMVSGKYDKDKINAAKELLAATRGPDNIKMELEVGMYSNAKEAQDALNSKLAVIAGNQKKLLDQGASIVDVQSLRLDTVIEGEVTDE